MLVIGMGGYLFILTNIIITFIQVSGCSKSNFSYLIISKNTISTRLSSKLLIEIYCTYGIQESFKQVNIYFISLLGNVTFCFWSTIQLSKLLLPLHHFLNRTLMRKYFWLESGFKCGMFFICYYLQLGVY